jgi:predicted transcriptional regulator
MLTKEDMLKAIAELPDDATFEDAVEKLHLLEMIDSGIADIEAGRAVTHDEAKQRMAHWLR